MTKESRSKQSTMFDTLAKKTAKRVQADDTALSVLEIAADLKANEALVASESLEPSEQRRSRAKTGKRSDPTYTQVGCYLPRDLNNKVKVQLVEDSRDFSDLVAELLNNWLSS